MDFPNRIGVVDQSIGDKVMQGICTCITVAKIYTGQIIDKEKKYSKSSYSTKKFTVYHGLMLSIFIFAIGFQFFPLRFKAVLDNKFGIQIRQLVLFQSLKKNKFTFVLV